MLKLASGVTFDDLYSVDGAVRIDRRFIERLAAADRALADRLVAARAAPDSLARKDESTLLIDVAPHVEDFIAHLFEIESEVRALEGRHHALAPLFAVRRQFVQRKAMNAHKPDAAATFDGDGLRAALAPLLGDPQGVKAFEGAFADAVTAWQKD